MPRLDIVVAALWPGEDLAGLVSCAQRTAKLPNTFHVLDASKNPERRKTLSAAWNDLAAQGHGDFVAFMRTDVILPTKWDVQLVECLEAFPQVGVALPAFFGDERPIRLVNEGPTTSLREGVPSPTDMAALAEWAEMFTGVLYLYDEFDASFSTAVMRRSLWEALKGFDERFRVFGHDHDFQKRMNKETEQVAASARSCPVYSRSGRTSLDSIMRIHADLKGEYAHLEETRLLVDGGSPWHKMLPADRETVRADPKFSHLPLSMFGLKTRIKREAKP